MPESNPDPTKSSASTAAKKNGAFQIAKEPVIASVEEVEVHKFEIGSETESTGPAAPAYEDLGQLPETYFEDTLFLVARDPRWLFSYWDFNWAKYPVGDFRGGVKQFFLKVTTTAGARCPARRSISWRSACPTARTSPRRRGRSSPRG